MSSTMGLWNPSGCLDTSCKYYIQRRRETYMALAVQSVAYHPFHQSSRGRSTSHSDFRGVQDQWGHIMAYFRVQPVLRSIQDYRSWSAVRNIISSLLHWAISSCTWAVVKCAYKLQKFREAALRCNDEVRNSRDSIAWIPNRSWLCLLMVLSEEILPWAHRTTVRPQRSPWTFVIFFRIHLKETMQTVSLCTIVRHAWCLFALTSTSVSALIIEQYGRSGTFV